MRVCVLGRVAVQVDGVDVSVPAGKPLAILAMLALAKGRPVPAEQLVIGLWGEDAAMSASKTLQVHVSTLRSRIRGSGVAVSLTSAGYLLEVDDDEIDIVRFERLAERGILAAADGRPDVAARVLHEAMQLWSGDPLGNVLDVPFAAAEADRLVLRRVAVVQARVDADLALGLGATLVDEVRAFADANPYDERAAGQLMVCLYRAGKPAAALDVYRALRARLGDDLGLEPGPELTELERQVLVHDDRLLAQPAGAARRHNLPQEMSSFIGREFELVVVCDHVRRSRLTTVTGAGGAGKTRLAIAAASSLLTDPFEGVWLVELAPLMSAELIGYQLAEVVGARAQDGLQGLVDSIGDRSLLVVLDNCEHLIDSVATTAEHLLRRCPNLRLLATSREPLAIDGERVYRVPPLTLAAGDDGDIDAIGRSDAVRLFADRATWQRPDFVVDDRNAMTVARICIRLDGLPLAIELAVARLRTMPVEELAERLDDRFRLLTGSTRRGLPRQQTLRALVDWSYDLLNRCEQLMLDRLSVFVGGFTLGDVEAVVADDSSLDALELVTALLDKSLIEGVGENSGRFRLLETIREYAAERLVQRGTDVVTEARLAHANHFLALTEEAAPWRPGHDQLDWLERLAFEHDNLRAAAQMFLEQPGLVGRGLRLANCAQFYWDIRGHWFEALTLMKALLSHPDARADTDGYCRGLCNATSWSLTLDGLQADTEDFAARAEKAAMASTDPELHLLSAITLARLDGRQGNGCRARERLDDFPAGEVPEWLQGDYFHTKAINDFSHGDLMATRLNGERAAAVAVSRGDLFQAAMEQSNLASIDIAESKFDEATTHLEQAQTNAALVGDHATMAYVKLNFALVALRSSDPSTARIRYREALRFCSPTGNLVATLCCLLGLAACSIERDDLVTAATLHGFIDASHGNVDAVFDPSERTVRRLDRERLRIALGDRDFEEAVHAGGRFLLAHAMDLAKTIR